jgi:hypothetical protein
MYSQPKYYPSGPSPSTTNCLSPVACAVCGLPAELELALVLEFERPLERLLCGLTGVGRYTICRARRAARQGRIGNG